MQEIKSCPFCGGKGVLSGEVRYFVKCSNCRARVGSSHYIHGDEKSELKAKERAVEMWNRRV